jgi:hypothetical protein
MLNINQTQDDENAFDHIYVIKSIIISSSPILHDV